MITPGKKSFLIQSEIKAGDFVLKRKVDKHLTNLKSSVDQSIRQFHHLDALKKHAKNTRWASIENLDSLLLEFEKNFLARGGKIIWAETVAEAQLAILNICKQHNAKNIIKSGHSMLQELKLNDFLDRSSIAYTETKTDNLIQQLDAEAPFHEVHASMHKNEEDIANLFYKKLNTEPKLIAKELVDAARKNIRPKFSSAEVGITGADFLLADIGGVCFLENEGNQRLCAAVPQAHITVAGIDKMLASIDDLATLAPLYSSFANGQKNPLYNTIISGPRNGKEKDGPAEMYVILIDNGRSNILADTTLRESLYCISCGACANVCPVFKHIGGPVYETPHVGPIGAVLAPHLHDFEGYQHLSFASTLCGACTVACPINIQLDKILHYNRTLAHVFESTSSQEDKVWTEWKKLMSKNSLSKGTKNKIKKFMLKNFFDQAFLDSNEKKSSASTFSIQYKNKGH